MSDETKNQGTGILNRSVKVEILSQKVETMSQKVKKNKFLFKWIFLFDSGISQQW